MARKRVDTLPRLQSWDEVDQAMHTILECQSCIDEITVEMNRQIGDVKDSAAQRAQPASEQIRALEADIKEFVIRHRDEMSGKTRQLNFGSTGFRLTTNLVVPPTKSADIIESLRHFGMDDCINTKESVNKDVLRRYKSEDILKVGAYLKSTDDFWYEVDKTQLQPAEQ